MIKLETNTLVFGCGDIVISTVVYGLMFSQLNKPQQCGKGLNDLEDDCECIGEYPLYFDTYQETLDLLKKVKAITKNKNQIFTFKNLTFDFSYYNKESVRILKDAIEKVQTTYLLALVA